MTAEEIIQGVKDKGWSYTQPYRMSMRDTKWAFQVLDDSEDDSNEGLIDHHEGTREEMYVIYLAVVKGLGHDATS